MLERLKSAYLLWLQSYQKLPKTHRYTLGQKIDWVFIEAIELVAEAAFLTPAEKLIPVKLAIKKVDVIKILLMILWESDSLEMSKYVLISAKIDEVGRQLGGWSGQLIKQNSPATKATEK